MAQRKRVGLITQRSEDRNLSELIFTGVAQLVERVTFNHVVRGSSPLISILEGDTAQGATVEFPSGQRRRA